MVGVEQTGGMPAKKAGIRNGDMILKVNDISLQNTRHMEEILMAAKAEPLTLTLERNEKEITVTLTQKQNQSGQYICGMWLRDSAAGIGTVTFVTEDKTSFAALGHPVNDTDTDRMYSVRRGQLEAVEIKGARFSNHNRPGELIGVFSDTVVGTILSNEKTGIRGTVENQDFICRSPIPVCLKEEVKPGKATILSTVSEAGTQEYEIEIVKILDSYDNKNFILRVTDEALLSATGGIVQGMSGSPVIQNGKIVGAVTHVFVNDPTRGYGIFIENMLAEAKKTSD